MQNYFNINEELFNKNINKYNYPKNKNNKRAVTEHTL